VSRIKKSGILINRIFTLLFIFIFSLTSCEQAFYLVNEVGTLENGGAGLAAPQVLSLSPGNITVLTNSTTFFTASGGNPPYNYTVFSGTGTINPTTGEYLAPATSGSAVVRVTDNSSVSIDAAVTINDATTNVDYQITTSPVGGTIFETGTAINESFTITNLGTGAGSATVFWSAYRSADTTFSPATDSIFDSGSFGGLAASGSYVVNVSGSWPAASGLYYIILVLTASDDLVGGNNESASTSDFTVTDPLAIYPSVITLISGGGQTFTASGGTPPYTYSLQSGTGSINSSTGVYSAPGTAGNDVVRVTDTLANTADATVTISAVASNVDYGAVTVSNTGGTLGGGALTGNFIFTNGGTTNGAQTVNWEVYVSDDGFIGAGDALIDSGTTAALNASQVSGSVAFTGTWPNTSALYNLIVKVSASDDTSTADNTGLTAVMVSDPDVNYVVSSVTAANTPAVGGSSISESFYVQNIGASDGTQPVFWTAYISTDNVFDGADVLIDSGQTTPLTAAGSAGPLNIDSGSWPSVSGVTPYYLIVNLSSSDEIAANTGNNATVSLPFSITKPNIDYIVNSVSNNNTPANVSTAINESFTYRNNGSNNGTANVLWTAYASTDQVLDGSDQILSSGSVPALAAGNTSGNITINGNWPATGGSYYILVTLTSSDETNVTNNYSTSGLFTIMTVTAEPDYVVESITRNYPMVTNGSIISETLVVRNASTTGGTQQITCDIFLSSDTVFGADTWVGDVTTGSLGAGGVSGNISINAAWPSTGTYYIFVQLSAPDETVATANNIAYAGSFTVVDPPDYKVTFDEASVRVTGQTNSPLFGTPQLRIENLTTNVGQTPISWKVYRSTDTVLGAGDTEIAAGVNSSLSGSSSVLIPFTSTENWPAQTGLYYLIATISADDDENSANDMSQYVVAVANTVLFESEPNDAFANSGGNGWDANSHTGVTLGAGQSIVVEGIMDGFGGFDVIGFDTGVINAAQSITFVIGWNTGYDDIDFQIYDGSDGTVSVYTSADISTYSEPAISASITPFPDFSTNYVAVDFWLDGNTSGSTGRPYGLIIYANP
jgi:hypothetical protein